MSNNHVVLGVCCQYCKLFEKPKCPVKTAEPWSSWQNYCNMYDPDPNKKDALSLAEGISRRLGDNDE